MYARSIVTPSTLTGWLTRWICVRCELFWSVWLAWFMIEVMQRFAEVADNYNDTHFAATCRAEAEHCVFHHRLSRVTVV